MSTYIEDKNEDGSTVLVEVAEETGGVVRASRHGVSVVESDAKTKT